jgi:hypothetical protein
VGACVLVVAVVLSVMLKEVPLRTMSGQQARAMAAAGDDAADAAQRPTAATVAGSAASAAPVDVAPMGPQQHHPASRQHDPAASRHGPTDE